MRRMQNLEYIFVCTPFFRPRSFELSRLLTLAFDIWEYAAIAYILVGFLYELLQGKLKQRKIHAVVYLLGALKIWEVITAALNGALYFAKVVECVGTIALALYADAMMQKTRTQIVKYLSVLTGILLFINNLSYLYMGSPDYADATGNPIFFWQTRNHLSSLVFLAMVAAYILLNSHVRRTWWQYLWGTFVFINVLAAEILYYSGTRLTGLIAFLVAAFVFKHWRGLWHPKLIAVALLLINAAIVFLRIQDIFAGFIENVLHKNLSLTGRTGIWDTALLIIAQSPLIGHGTANIINVSFAETTLAAHNQILETAIQSGVVGALLLILLIFMTMAAIAKQGEGGFSRWVCAAMIGYMVMIIAEGPSPYEPWYIIMCMAFNLSALNQDFVQRKWQILRNGKLRRVTITRRGNE